MSRLFEAANRYIETSDWKIIAVLKFCLISLGMIIGMQIRPLAYVAMKLSASGVANSAGRIWSYLCSPYGQVLSGIYK